MATSRYCQPLLIYFWTKSTKLCALGCPISQPASEGSPTKSSGAPVRGPFHKMHGKEFLRSAIDLALEQTVNRDAASPMRGIVGFYYSYKMVHHIYPTRNICDGTAAYGRIRNNRAASNAVTSEQNRERRLPK